MVYQKKWIGLYENGIGYGNISQRFIRNQFFISGSSTGKFEQLTEQHFSLVSAIDIARNTVHCSGPIRASSESMSHGVIYKQCPEVQAVIHIHNLELWKKLLHKVPTTNASAAYGTPEMAYSIIELLGTTDLKHQKIFVMEGHYEGVFAFGESLTEALETLNRSL